MPANHLTYSYAPHNLCGGPSHKTVRQGAAPASRDGLIQPPTAAEGHFVTREKGYRSWTRFKQNLHWAKEQGMLTQSPTYRPVGETWEKGYPLVWDYSQE